MNTLLNRLNRAEAHAVTTDFGVAPLEPVFELPEPVSPIDAVGLDELPASAVEADAQPVFKGWRHRWTGQEYTTDQLMAAREKHPAWAIGYIGGPDRFREAFVSDTPPEDWSDEERARQDALWDEMEREAAAAEYRVVRGRLAMGTSVAGYDPDLVARVKAELGLA